MKTVDVIIAGAGPVGLFLACELGLAGCSVVILEMQETPFSSLKAEPLGMRGFSATTVEAFYRRDMLSALTVAIGADADDHNQNSAEDSEAENIPPPGRVGHFAGILLDPAKVDLQALPFRLPGPATQGVRASIEAVEAVLCERAVACGVAIHRNAPVSAISQNDEMVIVEAGGRSYAAHWLVGCDGGRSTVRGLAGFDFVGTEPRFTGYTMLADVEDSEKLCSGFNLTPTGMYILMPFKGHLAVMDFDGGAFDRTRPLNKGYLQDVLRRVSGTDVTLNAVHLASTYTDRAMQATTYRRGRVLLAGDAAHIHSPLGGQGLNLGIGDAMNLGWKLAATVRAEAPEGLLDSYTRERHPVGCSVLDWSRAQVAAMTPDSYGQALQHLLGDLLQTRDGTTYVFERISGSAVRYDLGREHPLVGRSAPDFHLVNGPRLGELMQGGQGVVLDFSPQQSLRHLAAAWASRITYAAGAARNQLGVQGVLVRPDGIIAWVGGAEGYHENFEKAAGRWFGHRSV